MPATLINKLISIAILGISLITSSLVFAGDDNRPNKQNEFITSAPLNWIVYLPKEKEFVIYKGVSDADKASKGNGASMLYPAPNAAGFLAAVITHGILAKSTQAREKSQLQEEADKVLMPYQSILAAYTYKQLMENGLKKVSLIGDKKLIGFLENNSQEWAISSLPIFSITQNQNAIVLENLIEIYSPQTSVPQFTYTVKVVSPSHKNDQIQDYWMANDGEKLKEESALVFAQSLDIAIQAALGKSDVKNVSYKTFRYFEGESERMERGQLINEGCQYITIKNLSGWLMSFPRKQDLTNPALSNCEKILTSIK